MNKLTVAGERTDSITRMPAFNKTITVQVDVDDIYKIMLDLLPEDYKHREVLAHAIVGSAVESGNVNYVYKALHGYTNDIDFEVGDVIICSSEERNELYDANAETEEGLKLATLLTEEYKPDWKRREVAIGRAKVIQIDLYSSNKLLIQFEQDFRFNDKPGNKETREIWMDHNKCSRVPDNKQ